MKQIIRRVAALIVGLGLGAAALAGLETVTHISDLNASWPLGSDLASTSDDHIRNIKTALKTDFPNVNGAVNPTPAQFNQLTNNTFTTALTANVASSSLTLNSTTNTNAASVLLNLGGVNKVRFGVEGTAGATITGSAANDAFAFTTGGVFRVSTDSGATSAATFANAGSTIQGATGSLTVNSSTSSNASNLFLALGGSNKGRIGAEGTGGATITGSSANDIYVFLASGNFLISNGGAAAAFKVGSSGNVTIAAPSSGTALSVTAVASNPALQLSGQPAFDAMRITSNVTLSASTITDLVFNSTNFQNGGTNYSTSTGIFTAPVAGIYTCVGSVLIQNNASGTATLNGIYFSKNNTTSAGASRVDMVTSGIAAGGTIGAASNALLMGGSVIFSLAASDTVRIKIDLGAVGGAGSVNFNQNSHFQCYLYG